MGEENSNMGGAGTADETTLTKTASNVFSIKDAGITKAKLNAALKGLTIYVEGTDDISTSSTSYVDMANMTSTNTFQTDSEVFVICNPNVKISASNQNALFQILEGASSRAIGMVYFSTSTTPIEKYVSPIVDYKGTMGGATTVKIQWKTNANTIYQLATGAGCQRTLIILEFPDLT